MSEPLSPQEIATARRRNRRADRIRRMTQRYHARKRGWKAS